MPFIIRFPKPLASLKDPFALAAWAVDWAKEVLAALQALVTLDLDVRKLRSENAETAQVFTSSAIGPANVIKLSTLFPQVTSEVYTTAMIHFDQGSGSGRWLCTGADPAAVAVAASGMPIPAGGFQLNLVGRQNIANFAVIAEAGQALEMSVQLFK